MVWTHAPGDNRALPPYKKNKSGLFYVVASELNTNPELINLLLVRVVFDFIVIYLFALFRGAS